MAIAPFRDPKEDTIKSGTLRLTWGSGFAAFVAAAATVYNDTFESIFGDSLAPEQFGWIKAAVLIAVILAFALIAVADIVSRGYVSAQQGAATSHSGTQVVAAPRGLNATLTDGLDRSGYMIAAIRYRHSQPDEPEYLVVKVGENPEWVSSKGVALSG